MSSETKEYIFTFGFGQKYQNSFIAIDALNENDARKELFRMFGDVWAFCYTSREKAGVDRYNLTEITDEQDHADT